MHNSSLSYLIFLFSKTSCERNHSCHVNNLPTKVFNEWWYVNCFFCLCVLRMTWKVITEINFLYKPKCTFFSISFSFQIHSSLTLFSTTNFIFLIILLFYKQNLTIGTKQKNSGLIHYFWLNACNIYLLLFFFLLAWHREVFMPMKIFSVRWNFWHGRQRPIKVKWSHAGLNRGPYGY